MKYWVLVFGPSVGYAAGPAEFAIAAVVGANVDGGLVVVRIFGGKPGVVTSTPLPVAFGAAVVVEPKNPDGVVDPVPGVACED